MDEELQGTVVAPPLTHTVYVALVRYSEDGDWYAGPTGPSVEAVLKSMSHYTGVVQRVFVKVDAPF